ncbi:MAG: hypothetical protein DU429_05900 [Candidatus Tokpelaia sp.]|uniref:hypothetical protein n=1 Tax=Candidatus Tokpelaia sp. TaxID=2233777 RepID=UPI00123B961E|nr:hypothetical protein [Candidatus Tokpelaia sp.]KAA6204753.1 MAG: hypothetical protein DU430_07350 [Candidatus Tokpelaia sp.]KAA6206764.1 MAG: hypothetical protein DU429_05900 [Candidatus Tokpelaia sp.]KAA6405341.1 hypothetical protein DPQ22_05585 [Candidatus Tokpelaia sp.]
MESIISLIIQLVSGGIGGNIAGIAKRLSLGSAGNSIVGAIGGLLAGQGFSHMLTDTAQGMMSGYLGQAVSSGVAGIILTAIIGFIRNLLARK